MAVAFLSPNEKLDSECWLHTVYIYTVKVRRNMYWSYVLGYFTRAIENHSHGENEVFQSNRNDFPKVSFTLDGIQGIYMALFCNEEMA
jgi:hypothetical protein